MVCINVREALEGTPRPHHLTGKAEYEPEGKIHVLRGVINFSSEHPSIQDRTRKYLSNPHVNAGDVLFAVWNGAHIIVDILGYTQRTLVDEIRMIPHTLIPPDTPLNLEVRLAETAHKVDKKGNPYSLGTVDARIRQNDELLAEVYSNTFVRK